MMNKPGRGRLFALVAALLLALVAPASAPGNAQAAELSATDLKVRAIYFQRTGKETDKALALNAITATSSLQGKLWTEFLADWSSANTVQKLNYATPSDLPTKGHVFVVLGASLSSTGKVTAQLERRLKLGLAALGAYPNSKILVTGGVPKNGVTEGKAMHDWLVAKGVATNRILVETKSSSTIGNAKYSMAILAADLATTSFTLISDASHIRRASVLFGAAALQLQEKSGKTRVIQSVKNVAHKDKTITNPASQATTDVIASNVVSLLGFTSSYSALTKNPPKGAVLTSLSVKALKKKYAVGAKLSRSNLAATAIYDQGAGARAVTSKVKLSGFTSTKVGKPKIKVTYAEGGVTKSVSYQVSVVKATTKASAKPSTTKVRKNRTRVTLKVKLTTTSGLVPTGTVRFYDGSKLVNTISLKASKKGAVSFRYATFAKTGKRSLKVSYSGDSKATSVKKTVKITVKR